MLTSLRKAGLIVSRRGPGGGHLLARPPQEITLAEVVEALEGALLGVTSEEPGAAPAPPATAEALHDLWTRVAQATRGVLETTTLADLAARARQRAYTYYI